MVGREGRVLNDDVWADYPDNWKSVMAPFCPNYYVTCGPNWPTIHNSLLPLFEEVLDSIFYMVQRMQVYNLHSIEPKYDVVKKQMVECQEYLKNTVSYDTCNAWFVARLRQFW
jgi:hypothetical protein